MNKLLIFFACAFATSFSYAEIRSTDSLEPIAQEFELSDTETVVLLDIGGTLLVYCDPIMHQSHEKWKREWFQRNCPNLTKEEKIVLVRIMEGATENWRLVDTHWPETIAKAQTHGAKVLAFSKVAMDPSLKGTRAKKLAAFGVPIKNDLPELCSGSSFEYDSGVIETESDLKGPVLEEVILSLPQKPKKIIFVDDRIEQIKSVEEVCKKNAIPCIAFHYTATLATPELDVAVADYQLRTLVKQHQWISAPVAKALLQKPLVNIKAE